MSTSTLVDLIPAGSVIRAVSNGVNYTGLVLRSKSVLALRVGDKTWKKNDTADRPSWASVETFLTALFSQPYPAPKEGSWVVELKYPDGWFNEAQAAYNTWRQTSSEVDRRSIYISNDTWQRCFGAARKKFQDEFIQPLMNSFGLIQSPSLYMRLTVGTANAPSLQAPAPAVSPAGLVAATQATTTALNTIVPPAAPVVLQQQASPPGNYLQTGNYFQTSNYFQNRAAPVPASPVPASPVPSPAPLVRSPALQGAALQVACGVPVTAPASDPQYLAPPAAPEEKLVMTREEFGCLYLLIAGKPLHDALWNHIIHTGK
jgi:hypothetical protein